MMPRAFVFIPRSHRSRNSRRMILPVAVSGNSSMKTISRGA
jgi:hypothetical protein